MSQIFVKLRLRGNVNKYRKLLSTDDNIYEPFEEIVDSSYQYRPDTLLDAGDWFKISEFSKERFAIDLIKADFESVDYDSLKNGEYALIDYVFVKIGENMYFQKISKTKLARKKHILELGEEYRYISDAAVLTINTYPDAIYNFDEDALYFQRLETITGIFKGITELYREATSEEVEEFLKNDFITLENGFGAANIKTANRKRIALAIETLSNMQDNDKKKIFEYIHEYCPNLRVTDNKFNIGSEDNLKSVLFGIEQRFYTTLVGNEKRYANSVVIL